MKKSLLYYIIILIPAIVYFATVKKYAVNIPIQDDYNAILGFLSRYKAATGLDRLILLFSQHNEHRIFSSRVIFVLYYTTTGHVDFRDIIYIGNIQLLALLAILVALIRKAMPQQWLLPSFITSLCLFDLNGWENATFAMASMQNFGIVLLFVSALYAYSRVERGWKWAGALLQIIAIFSSGNGMLAAGILCGYTIFSKDRLVIILSLATLLIFTPLYLVHYEVPTTGHPSTDVVRMVNYFLHIICAHFVSDSKAISIIWGGCLIIVSILVVFPFSKKGWASKELLPLIFLMLFLLASMALITPFRCNLELQYYISSRYMIYSNLLVALIFIFFLVTRHQMPLFYPTTAAIILLLLVFYKVHLKHGSENLEALSNKLNTTRYYYKDSIVADRITIESCRLKIYCIEEARVSSLRKK